MRTLSFIVIALILTITLSLTASTSFVQAWWSQGHMLVAQIAKLNMDQRTIDIVDAHFQYLNVVGPFDKTTDMVTGASWADDIKSYGLEAPSPWHFTNTPLVLNGYDYKDINCSIQEDNAASLLEGFIHGVTERWAPHKPVTNAFTNAFATAYVVHLSGDLSQPLHNDNMYDKHYPDGDRGGNRIKVNFPPDTKDITNLHSVWDSVCGKYPNGFDRPLSAENRAALVKLAQELNNTYPLTEKEAAMTAGWDMHDEAFELAKYIAYPYAFTDGETINQTYIDQCIPVAERQLVRAGIRLARNLKYMFRTFTEVPNYVAGVKARAAASGPAAGPAPEEWNSKATGGLFGGIILGVGLCIGVFVVNKYLQQKNGGGGEGGAGGYSSVNNNQNANYGASV